MDVRGVQAYAEAVNRAATSAASGGGEEAGKSAKAGGAGFSDLLKETMQSSVQGIAEGERMSIAAAAKQADIVDVVTAVTNAELTLQTVVAVRDKVIEAYQDIMKMPI